MSSLIAPIIVVSYIARRANAGKCGQIAPAFGCQKAVPNYRHVAPAKVCTHHNERSNVGVPAKNNRPTLAVIS